MKPPYTYSECGEEVLKISTVLNLPQASMERHAADAYNRFVFLPAYRAMLDMQSGVTERGKKETDEAWAEKQANVKSQSDYVQDCIGINREVDMVEFVNAGDSLLRRAKTKYDDSPNKAAFVKTLESANRLPANSPVPSTYADLVLACETHDLNKLWARRAVQVSERESGKVVKVGGKKVDIDSLL
jgi:hypothetical protein